MLLTTSLASGAGDHLRIESDATFSRASIAQPLRSLFRETEDQSTIRPRLFIVVIKNRAGWQLAPVRPALRQGRCRWLRVPMHRWEAPADPGPSAGTPARSGPAAHGARRRRIGWLPRPAGRRLLRDTAH